MESKSKLDEFLYERMSVERSGITQPAPELVNAARKRILSLKKVKRRGGDVFYLVASFLDLRVRLNHAVLALMLISTGLMYVMKENNDPGYGPGGVAEQCDMMSVKNATVLPGTNTYRLNQ
jgi:hypothetical protein